MGFVGHVHTTSQHSSSITPLSQVQSDRSLGLSPGFYCVCLNFPCLIFYPLLCLQFFPQCYFYLYFSFYFMFVMTEHIPFTDKPTPSSTSSSSSTSPHIETPNLLLDPLAQTSHQILQHSPHVDSLPFTVPGIQIPQVVPQSSATTHSSPPLSYSPLVPHSPSDVDMEQSTTPKLVSDHGSIRLSFSSNAESIPSHVLNSPHGMTEEKNVMLDPQQVSTLRMVSSHQPLLPTQTRSNSDDILLHPTVTQSKVLISSPSFPFLPGMCYFFLFFIILIVSWICLAMVPFNGSQQSHDNPVLKHGENSAHEMEWIQH